MASYAENISIWWRHHAMKYARLCCVMSCCCLVSFQCTHVMHSPISFWVASMALGQSYACNRHKEVRALLCLYWPILLIFFIHTLYMIFALASVQSNYCLMPVEQPCGTWVKHHMNPSGQSTTALFSYIEVHSIENKMGSRISSA